jgi:hypothetical protein
MSFCLTARASDADPPKKARVVRIDTDVLSQKRLHQTWQEGFHKDLPVNILPEVYADAMLFFRHQLHLKMVSFTGA